MAVLAAGPLGAFSACEVAEPDAALAGASDTKGGDTEVPDTNGAPDSPDTASPPAGPQETMVSRGGEVGEARDDLFPDLSGADLVWLRSWLDVAAPGAMPETDCLTCPYCTGCRFDVMHRVLPDGEAEMLYEGRSPRASPRVGDGLAVWLDDGGSCIVRDLAQRVERQVTVSSWLQTTPTPRDGRLWWYGYDNWSGSYGLSSYDMETSISAHELTVYIQDPHWSPSSQLSQLLMRQPFAVGHERIVWVAWDGNQVVQQWAFGGDLKTIVSDPERIEVRALLLEDDLLVTMSQAANVGCPAGVCELAFTAFAEGEGEAWAEAAEPSRYVPPVADGQRLVWLDRRDGLYQVWGAGEDGREVRLSGDEAVIGASSTLAASEGRVVWADRRSGRFRLMAREW